MNVLVVGNGGREHALIWKLSQSPLIRSVFSWPYAPLASHLSSHLFADDFKPKSHDQILSRTHELGIDFIVVGPETPLAAGFADHAREMGIPVFGPQRAAAQLESSKAFAKAVMKLAGIPTAYHEVVSIDKLDSRAREFFSERNGVVIKADGLAAGKGVFVCTTSSEVDHALNQLTGGSFGEAAQSVVLEEVLRGRECSYFVFLGQGAATPLGFAVDFKRRNDMDQGPNTGGMGCYTPVPWLPIGAEDTVWKTIVIPLLDTLARQSIEYTGFLYIGLMWTLDGPKVIEFNVRLGDPEAQVMVVQDRRDWVPIILHHLKMGSPPTLAPIDQTARTTCVVLASSDYATFSEPAPDPSSVPTALVRAEDHSCIVFAGTNLKVESDSMLSIGRGRVMTVVAGGASFAEARARMYARAEAISEFWPTCHYRRDIAILPVQEEP